MARKTRADLEFELEALQRAAYDVVYGYVRAEAAIADKTNAPYEHPYAYGMLAANVPALARALGMDVPKMHSGAGKAA